MFLLPTNAISILGSKIYSVYSFDFLRILQWILQKTRQLQTATRATVRQADLLEEKKTDSFSENVVPTFFGDCLVLFRFNCLRFILSGHGENTVRSFCYTVRMKIQSTRIEFSF